MTWRNRNLYLIGLPGSGKSAIGQELSSLLERFEFVDLDREIECKTGKTIEEIFLEYGEDYFRKIESNTLLEIASQNGSPNIIATGGGIVLNPTNRAIMRGSGIPIWIDVTVREAAQHVWNDQLSGSMRPMFNHATLDEIKTILSRLLEERRQWYEQAVLHFVRRSQVPDERSPQELAQELLTALDKMSLSVVLKPRHRTIIAKSALGNYPIFVGNGIASREIGYFVRENMFSNICIVTDENVAAIHLESFSAGIRQYTGDKIQINLLIVPSGELHKNFESVQSILGQFYNSGASRHTSLVIGFGGGVATDMTAFAAHLYHRGLPLALVPTTLIGQADAAIGGKTGIDAFAHKNVLGTIYPPRIIAVDPLYLRTLPDRDRIAGLAEVLKYGLIGNRKMWDRIASGLTSMLRSSGPEYEQIVFDSIQEKLRYVEPDEFERNDGIRELLNFGHTFGHALEAATNFKTFLHGEAVLLGMRTAAWLSNQSKFIRGSEWMEIETTLQSIPIERAQPIDADKLWATFLRDKKGPRRVILLRSIGEAFVTHVSEQDARRAIEYMLSIA